MKKQSILVLFAHPALHKSRVNIRMIETIKGLEGIEFRNLYELYPDFHIDIKREQQQLIENDIIVWHHPFYWYSAPAMLKEWIDLVLEHGFAYGRDGNALKGKKVLSAITAGGRREAYSEEGFNQFTMRQFLVPFQRTVSLCNMEYLPPFVVHGSHLLQEEQMKNTADDYKKILISLRDNLYSSDEIRKQEYLNDLINVPKT
jgi:glutathione-regulated potassium-efflux system ancillary protein KefG